MPSPMKVRVTMRVRLRKPHACGGSEWEVTRTGADVGLKCEGCSRRIMLEREEFERRVKIVLWTPPEPETPVPEP
ncbi:MAG: DUF951 domain-containing protein [Chthonomonadaceae bacterium]|nr:DUF951 domain-containing protein [Chthonomonadaceae bacterium]